MTICKRVCYNIRQKIWFGGKFMISDRDIIADLHTHTAFSKHAYSTVKENVEVAKSRGLKYVAITDHYFGNGDKLERKNEINRIQYLGERVNTVENGITVVGSAEFNLNQKVEDFYKLKDLLWKPIGFHNWFVDLENTTLDDVFNFFVVGHSKGHNAFVHIERELHKINKGKYSFEECIGCLKRIVDYAKENNVWLEVNESTIIVDDGGAKARLCAWLKYAKEKGNKIYLGSDAHYCMEVGAFNNVLLLLNELEYPKELILNCNEDMLVSLFNV